MATRDERKAARNKIIQTANMLILARGRYTRATSFNRASFLPVKLLSARNINEAVAIVRHWKAVGDSTLYAAGFNSVRER